MGWILNGPQNKTVLCTFLVKTWNSRKEVAFNSKQFSLFLYRNKSLESFCSKTINNISLWKYSSTGMMPKGWEESGSFYDKYNI